MPSTSASSPPSPASPPSLSQEEVASRWAELSREEKLEYLQALKRAEGAERARRWATYVSGWYCYELTCGGEPHEGWHWCEHPLDSLDHTSACRHCRSEQRPPEFEWLIWLFQAGRGAGKTRSFAEWIIDRARKGLAKRIALVGRVPSDVRDVMVEGESGIMACSPRDFMPEYKPSIRRLIWPNGAVAITYSSENPSELRGPQHDTAWCDELAAWRDARKGDVIDTTWNNLMLGLRLGSDPKCGVSTTPKPVKLIKQLVEAPGTAVTGATTYDNVKNLAPPFAAQILKTYEGTRIGRQEVMGELLTDVEGALVHISMIDDTRASRPPEGGFKRVAIGVDPATTSGEQSDETGIVAVGAGYDEQGYVLGDYSVKAGPSAWAKQVVKAYRLYGADVVVVEGNQGGDAWAQIIHSIDPAVRVVKVTVRHGKRLRAEPAAALYEQGRMHHMGTFPALESEWTEWVPDAEDSPDRMDAQVHALAELGLLRFGQGYAFSEYWKRVGKDAPRPVGGGPPPPLALPPAVRCAPGECFYGPAEIGTGARRCTRCGLPPERVSATQSAS